MALGNSQELFSRQQEVVHALGKRVKELTALHGAARLLQDDGHSLEAMLAKLAELLPPATQHPEIAAARISHGATSVASAGWCDSEWRICEDFCAADGIAGRLEMIYVTSPPSGTTPAFLPEDHSLLESIADMLRTELDRRHALHLQGELEEHLRRAQKLDAIGRLAAGIAHDFNNLLTVIDANCCLLASDPLSSASQRDLVREISEVGKRGASLTRQLLVVGRKTALDETVLDPNALILRLEDLLRRVLGHEVQVRTELDPGIARVRVDAGHLEQALMNLVLNARDSMPRGGTVRITTRNTTLARNDALGRRGGAHVEIAVADTGVGMNKEVRARLFEPFFTTKAADRGSGLGLAIVFGVVRQSSGHIEVDSVEGRGTTMRVYLPSVIETAVATRVRATADARHGGA